MNIVDSMKPLTLAHDLLLLSLDPETGARRKRQGMDYGLVGALLAELERQGRIDLAGKHVVVTDAALIGDRCGDDLLRRIVEDKPRTPRRWVEKQHRAYAKDLLDDLVTAELVRRVETKVGGIFPTVRYPQIGGARRDDLLERLRQIMVRGLTPTDPGLVTLAGIVVAVQLHGQVFPGTPRRELKKRLDSLEQAGWVSQAVRRAIEAVESGAAAVVAGA